MTSPTGGRLPAGPNEAAWSAGDFPRIAGPLLGAAEQLCADLGLRTGQRVVDLGTGSGTAAIAAAHHGAVGVGVDLVRSWLGSAEERARAAHLSFDWARASVRRLPFRDGAFDAGLSNFGIGFAPGVAGAVAELARVVRPGGAIGLAHWTDQGFTGPLLAEASRHLPPGSLPNDLFLLGREHSAREVLATRFREVRMQRRELWIRAPSEEAQLKGMLRFLGPVRLAAERMEEEERAAFREGIRARIGRLNRATDGTVLVPSEYLEVLALRR